MAFFGSDTNIHNDPATDALAAGCGGRLCWQAAQDQRDRAGPAVDHAAPMLSAFHLPPASLLRAGEAAHCESGLHGATPWVTTAKSNRSLKSGANHPRRCMHGARLRYRGATKAEFPERAGTVDAVSQCRDPSPESPRASLRSAISSEGGVAQ